MKRLLQISLLVASCFLPFSSSYGANPNEKIFNPHPSKDDVVINLPCDQIMVFKKIYTQIGKNKKIYDKAFISGTINNQSPMSMNRNTRYIQGSFIDDHGIYYLIGKYELMQGQYFALTQGFNDKAKCKKPTPKDRLPATNISYYDIINATRNLSLFLQNSPKAPKEGGQVAIARMATDEEWEYAARGGGIVSESIFEADLPFLDNVSDYAWHSGAQSSNGKLQLTGLKKSTPNDLYDILGNAEEMVLTPFKAVKAGRLMGQSGSICVRGGSFNTSKDRLTIADRTEKPYFIISNKKAKEMTSPFTGTRLVLSVSVANNLNEVKELNQDIVSLGDEEEGTNSLNQASLKINELTKKSKEEREKLTKEKENLLSKNQNLNNEKVSLEESLAKKEELYNLVVMLNDKLVENNERLYTQLDDLKIEVEQANSERTHMREVAVSANLRLGAFLCKSVADENLRFEGAQKIVDEAKERLCPNGLDNCPTYKKRLDILEKRTFALNTILTYYGDTLAQASSNYTKKEFKNELMDARNSIGQGNNLDNYLDTYYEHLLEYDKLSKDLNANFKHWSKACVKTKEETSELQLKQLEKLKKNK